MTREDIITAARSIFARKGYEGLGMRTLAAELKCALSVLYYHFENKDQILKTMFDETNTALGVARNLLPEVASAKAMLEQRIIFQFEHSEEVIAVLKYYLHFRDTFAQKDDGLLPVKAYQHMLEVVEKGIVTGEFHISQAVSTARMLTHSVNGFLLEYYPKEITPKELRKLTKEISTFLAGALTSQSATSL
jgi:AcrR family transcriptional regulator